MASIALLSAPLAASKNAASRRIAFRIRRSFQYRKQSSIAMEAGIESGAAKSVAQDTAVVVDRAVGYWLLGCSGLVASMVTIGGLTRLTKSGLSMAYWKPTRVMPPVTSEEWGAEFEVYKRFPEWQQRQSMTLDEFKFIFYWEYGHRMLGRLVGVAFGAPLAYFLARGRIPAHLRGRMAGLFALGGSQGVIGWWMVKSGLEVDPKQRKEIRVSPYRLATHLGMAFTTYSLLLWTALDVLNPLEKSKRAAASMMQAASESGPSSAAAVKRLSGSVRAASLVTAGVVMTTALSGAFVAGNDAGRAYNTFPMMDGRWVPEGILELSPVWRNAFENTATVQLDHRVLAYASSAAVLSTAGLARFGAGGALWKVLPGATRVAIGGMGAMLGVQVGLGVSTLLLYVPIELAAAHQLGSLALLSFTTAAAHSLRVVPFQFSLPITFAAGVGGAIAAPAMVIAGSTVASASALEK